MLGTHKSKQGDPLQRPCRISVLVVPSGNENRERRHGGRGRLFSNVSPRMKTPKPRLLVLVAVLSAIAAVALYKKHLSDEEARSALIAHERTLRDYLMSSCERADFVLICRGVRSEEAIRLTLEETIRVSPTKQLPFKPGDLVTSIELRGSAVGIAPVDQAVYWALADESGGSASNTIPVYDGKLAGSGITLDELRVHLAQ